MFCRRYGHAWKPVLAALILLITAAAGGLSIARRLEWHQISSDPPIWIFSGWTGGDIYDVELRIRPDCLSRPTRLLFPNGATMSTWRPDAKPGSYCGFRFRPWNSVTVCAQSLKPFPSALPSACALSIWAVLSL